MSKLPGGTPYIAKVGNDYHLTGPGYGYRLARGDDKRWRLYPDSRRTRPLSTTFRQAQDAIYWVTRKHHAA